MEQPPSHSLSYNHDYHCPLCRRGRITNLSMMEAFSCNFCEHLFTADLDRQLLTAVDTQLPLTWQWNRTNWTRINPEGVKIGWSYLILGILWVILPTAIVGFASYLFPPLPGSGLSWFPLFWTIVTFLSHFICLIWLLLEYYQFPVRLYLQAVLRSSFS
ncbi:hypothetical protein [Gloeocapsa sp. PCC 73106]|uniref:hypothetical protein n=1 Tax=Gloeocapsa sp. PCC 73106 TaxID=102232 RepID=UPI0002AC7AA3|nr:hypothetical protein [Gloeocapsa sp. PCC 73106]ELR97537.1 hypothetical protein GLO73106DRAFT_00013470 [Gloeocapsa sp. PCC 73106]